MGRACQTGAIGKSSPNATVRSDPKFKHMNWSKTKER